MEFKKEFVLYLLILKIELFVAWLYNKFKIDPGDLAPRFVPITASFDNRPFRILSVILSSKSSAIFKPMTRNNSRMFFLPRSLTLRPIETNCHISDLEPDLTLGGFLNMNDLNVLANKSYLLINLIKFT